MSLSLTQAQKTSVLFLQKWDDNLCPFKENYNIFFATMNEPSKDNSGDKIYVKEKVALLRQTINNKSNEQTLSLKEFNEKYESVEKASFLQYEDSIISLESYKKLDSKEKQKVLKQEAFIIEQPLRDTHGHLIVKHDLFNHDGLTQDGIAEAFIDFAKMENLSFWRE